MSRYYFHLQNDMYVEDEEGRECSSLEAVRAAAVAEARVMASSSVIEGQLNLSHAVNVTDSSGRPVLTIRFGDAVEVRP